MLIERLPDEYSALVKQYNEAKDERTKFEISYKLTELTVKRVAEAAEQRKRAIDEYNKAHPTNPITSANDLPSYAPYSPPKRAAERPSQYVPALPPAPWYTAVPYSPSMVQIADQVPGLVRQYADAKDDKAKSEARSRLADVLGKQFAQQQAQQKQQIDQLQAQLKRLQELMSKRESACKQIVDQRIDQLLRDAEGLGWLPTAPGVTVPVYNRYAPYPVLPVVPETRATTIPANPSAVEAKPKENVPPPVSIPAPGR
jgi:SOS-response transcriptional repressor LexA